MSVRTLLTGVLAESPTKRTGQSGKPFTTSSARVDVGQKTIWVNLIAFGSAGEDLAAMNAGDSVSVSGRAEPKAWMDKTGAARASLDVVADAVMSVEGPKRKSSVAASPAAVQAPTPATASASDGFEIDEF